VNEATERKILRLVGLGVRARTAVVGVDQVRRAAERGKVHLGLGGGADAATNSRKKVLPLLAAKGVAVLEVPSAERLGGIAGRASTAAVGILDARLARGMKEAIETEGAGSSDPEGSAGGTG
jgi:ribosomal protein L7Ae-like RNA K-turn-binding protein